MAEQSRRPPDIVDPVPTEETKSRIPGRPPDIVDPITTDIRKRQILGELTDDAPDYSLPAPTIDFPTMMSKDFVLELRVPPDSMKAFDAYKAAHGAMKIRVVPE